MFNSFGLDMFVMRKKKSSYITAVLIFATAILFCLVYKFSAAAQAAERPATFMDVLNDSLHLSFMFFGIFYVMFLGSDIKDGYIKNIAGSVKSRMGYLLSKQAALAVYTLISIAITAAGAFVFSALMLDGAAEGFEVMTFLKYIVTVFILFMGFSSLISFCVFFLRGTTVAMIFSVIISGYILNNSIYRLIEMLLNKFKINFDLAYISVSKQMIALDIGSSDKAMFTACAVGLGYIAVFGLLGNLVLNKKDIA